MWITVMNCDLTELTKLGWQVGYDTLIDPIGQKKYQLQMSDGAGNDFSEFPVPTSANDLPNADSMIIKNSWNTESAAQEFADFIRNLSPHIAVTIEQQP